ncbi:hypothetical protein HDE_10735 [Halotydeus destructor]|nr:hypothetical protein HDE_10735 [Halotydeus destructor]
MHSRHQQVANVLFVCTLTICVPWTLTSSRLSDPKLITYPGDVHFALIINTNDKIDRGLNGNNQSSDTCSGVFNANGVYDGMAAVWAAHQVNLKKGYPNQLKVGVYLYDGCSSASVVNRHSVRIVSKFNDVQSKSCKEPKSAPLFGAILPDKTTDTSLALFKSFNVPVILAKEPNYPTNGGPLFSVAPSLKYLSKGVMALLKRLNWLSATMVISNEAHYYTEIFEEIARKVHFNVIPSSMSSESMFEKQNGHGAEQSRPLVSSLKGSSPLSGQEKFNWILIVNEDITDKVEKVFRASSPGTCRTKSMFLMVPHFASTKEYHRYFLNEIAEFGNKSVHPLMSKYASVASGLSLDQEQSVATVVQAVWSLSMAFRKVEQSTCSPFMSKVECLERLRGKDLLSLVQNETQHLDDEIFGSSVASLEGFRLLFDKDKLLRTNRYDLKLVTSDCRLMKAGYFTDDAGLVLDETVFASLNVGFEHLKPEMDPVDGATLIASTTYYTPSFNSTEESVTPSSNQASSQGQPFVNSVDIDSDKVNLMPFFSRAGSNRVSIGGTLAMRAMLSYDSADHVNRKRSSASLVTWIGRPWSLAIMTSALGGALLTLYTFTFLLMKACEGALGRTNQALGALHLVSIVVIFVAAILYVLEPTPFTCTLRSSVRNVSLSLLFGILLIRLMYLRAQVWIGLGGKIPKLNQFLTLIFVFGIQVALEIQNWKYLSPWDTSVPVGPQLPFLCSSSPKEYLSSQLYLLIILSILLLFSWSSRRQPFVTNEANHVFLATLLILPLASLCIVICEQHADEFPEATEAAIRNARVRDTINGLTMICISFISLFTTFGPLLYTIHKYGVVPRKTASYADSLSTVFSAFQGAHFTGSGGGSVPGGRLDLPILSPDAMSQQGSSRSSSALGGAGASGLGSLAKRGPFRRPDMFANRKYTSKSTSGPVFSAATNSYTYFSGPHSNFRLSPRTTPLGQEYPKKTFTTFYTGGFERPTSRSVHSNSSSNPKNPIYGNQDPRFRSAYP